MLCEELQLEEIEAFEFTDEQELEDAEDVE
jgi:hypothetical protein